jgi:hypothetical protein
MVGRQHHELRVDHERNDVRRGIVRPRIERMLEHDNEVELTPVELGQELVRLSEDQRKLHLRVVMREARQCAGKKLCTRGGEESDAQQSPLTLAVGREFVPGAGHEIGDLLGVLAEAVARGGQPQAARASLHQRDTDLFLEPGQLVGDRRRAQPELLRRGHDGAVPGDLQQYLQTCRVEHRQTLARPVPRW